MTNSTTAAVTVTAIETAVNKCGWVVSGKNKSGTLVYVSPAAEWFKLTNKQRDTKLKALAKFMHGQCLTGGDWEYIRSTLRAVATGDAATALAAHDDYCTHTGEADKALPNNRFTAPYAKTWATIRNTSKRDAPLVVGFVYGTGPGSSKPATPKPAFDW